MTKITSLQAIAGALLAYGLSAAPAHALSIATFVSGLGTDSGACTRALPCKTFAFALSQTAAGGLIVVLDPSGYGKVTITKAISILNDGVGTAGIAVSSGDAITINAGPNDSVHLRGLTIQGLGSGSIGIRFNQGGNLAIENCVVRGFTNAGIDISPFTFTSSSFSVSNTIASNNVNGVGIGVSGAMVTGVLSNVTANNNFDGIAAGSDLGMPIVTVVDSEASNNSDDGVIASSGVFFGTAVVTLRNVVASNNGTGLVAGGGAILRVAHTVVTGNGNGVSTSGGGTLFSYGDNDIDGNTVDNTAALTTISAH